MIIAALACGTSRHPVVRACAYVVAFQYRMRDPEV